MNLQKQLEEAKKRITELEWQVDALSERGDEIGLIQNIKKLICEFEKDEKKNTTYSEFQMLPKTASEITEHIKMCPYKIYCK